MSLLAVTRRALVDYGTCLRALPQCQHRCSPRQDHTPALTPATPIRALVVNGSARDELIPMPWSASTNHQLDVTQNIARWGANKRLIGQINVDNLVSPGPH